MDFYTGLSASLNFHFCPKRKYPPASRPIPSDAWQALTCKLGLRVSRRPPDLRDFKTVALDVALKVLAPNKDSPALPPCRRLVSLQIPEFYSVPDFVRGQSRIN